MNNSDRCQHLRSIGWTVDEWFDHPQLNAKVCQIEKGTVGAFLFCESGDVMFHGPCDDVITWAAFLLYLNPPVKSPIPVRPVAKQKGLF